MEKSNGSGFQYLLIGIAVLGFLCLVGYQLLGCSNCYGASWIR